MPFDPTLPANNSPIVSAELRNQFIALKALIDAKPSTDDVNNAIIANSPAQPNTVYTLNMTVNDPPTQGDVQILANKIDELILALGR